MAELNFTKLADAPILEEVPDGAKVYAEVDGKVYRVAGDNLGGGGIPTAIFKFVEETEDEKYYTTCENMTFEEAKTLLLAGELLATAATFVLKKDGVAVFGCCVNMAAIALMNDDTQGYRIVTSSDQGLLYWFPDGTVTNDQDYGRGDPQ